MNKANSNSQPVRLSFNEVYDAPDLPGLYAWYGSIDIQRADYTDGTMVKGASGQRKLRQSLARHTARFDPRPRTINSRGAFGSRWRGEMKDLGRLRLQQTLLTDQDATGSGMAQTIHLATSEEASRKALVDVLRESAPWLAAPIYIGVTDSLRRRLREHADLFVDLKEGLRHDESLLTELQAKVHQAQSEFAERAVAAEFETNHLFVMVQPVTAVPDSSSGEAVRLVAEWLLNRWHRPLLGKN